MKSSSMPVYSQAWSKKCMDLKSNIRRQQPSSEGSFSGLEEDGALRHAADTGGKRRRPTSAGLLGRVNAIPFACVTVLLLATVVFVSHRDNQCSYYGRSKDEGSNAPRDVLLGGLLVPGHNETSCQSMYQSALYHKPSPHKPSPYLLQRLRNYEALHRRCGPNTEHFKRAMNSLDSKHSRAHETDCKYVVWVPHSGLGNKMISIVSSFLYALLTNRVLLLNRGADLCDLFCEPFPKTSWLLPLDSPITHQHSFNNDSLSYVFIHLTHLLTDKGFFCDEDQVVLGRMPWLVLQPNQYFAPALFLMPMFEEELGRLFPEKDSVFHHLSRYLFHPANPAWGMIVRSYQSYLANADERIGLQIRVFQSQTNMLLRKGINPTKLVLDQILQCTSSQNLLPRIKSKGTAFVLPGKVASSVALLITSLTSVFAESIKNMYWEYPTASGERVAVYQPSQEGHQQTDDSSHDMKALAEMYLLSLTDVLVTSGFSTFGYVAQGVGGLRPWILLKPENGTVPEPPCRRAISMEPCYHMFPSLSCKTKRRRALARPYVMQCEDTIEGIKLVNSGY